MNPHTPAFPDLRCCAAQRARAVEPGDRLSGCFVVAQAQELAAPLLLASGASSLMTGSVLAADGGRLVNTL
jgi:hypothetical protein